MKVSGVRKPYQATLAKTPSAYLKPRQAIAGCQNKQKSKSFDSTTHFYLHSPRSVNWLRGRRTKVVLLSFKTAIDADGKLIAEPEEHVYSKKKELGASPTRKGHNGRPGARSGRRARTVASVSGNGSRLGTEIQYGRNMETYEDNNNGHVVVKSSSFERHEISPKKKTTKDIKTVENSIRSAKTVSNKNTMSTLQSDNSPAEESMLPPGVTIKKEIDDTQIMEESNLDTNCNTTDIATVAIEYFQNAQRMVQLRAQLQQSDSRKKHYNSEVDLAQGQIRGLRNILMNLEVKCQSYEKQLRKDLNSIEKVKKEIESVHHKQQMLLLQDKGIYHSGQIASHNSENMSKGEESKSFVHTN